MSLEFHVAVSCRQSMDTIAVSGQIPVLDAEGQLQAGSWLPPSDAVAPFSYALEPIRKRQVMQEPKAIRCPKSTVSDSTRQRIGVKLLGMVMIGLARRVNMVDKKSTENRLKKCSVRTRPNYPKSYSKSILLYLH